LLSFLITAIKVIFLLGFLVFIHEGGHFLVAKLCKVKVNEFAIGFGPTIWQSKNTQTKYALRIIPLGGFVSMEGEDEKSEEEGSFSKTSIPKKIAIVMAGGIVNIIFGLLLFFVLASIVQNSLYYGLLSTGNFAASIIESLKMLFTGNVSVDQLTGPIGISSMVAQTQGIDEFVYLLSLISLSLGVTNLLPFPPLDGGKIVIYIIEAIRKKPMKEQTEINIQMIGFAILIGLTIFVAYNDIVRIS
jgi:regulator of sigma E protease